MLLVGLTGGIGTGKSVVSKIFQQNGIVVVDADEIAKYVVEPGQPAYWKLRAEFGNEYFDERSGRLKRQKLGQLVFHNTEKRKRLNSLVHPAVRREMIWRVVKAAISFQKIVVLDVPLFFESGYDRWISRSILVTCFSDKETQIARVSARDDLSEKDVCARIAAQMSTEEKIKRSMFVIDNNGTLDSTMQQTEEIIKLLKKSWQPIIVRVLLCLPFAVITTCVITARFIA